METLRDPRILSYPCHSPRAFHGQGVGGPVLKYWCPSQCRVPVTSLTYAGSDLGLLFHVRVGENQSVAQEPSEQPSPRHSRPCQKVSGPVAIEDDGEGEHRRERGRSRRGKMRKERQKVGGEGFLHGQQTTTVSKMALLGRRGQRHLQLCVLCLLEVPPCRRLLFGLTRPSSNER